LHTSQLCYTLTTDHALLPTALQWNEMELYDVTQNETAEDTFL